MNLLLKLERPKKKKSRCTMCGKILTLSNTAKWNKKKLKYCKNCWENY